MQKKKKKKKRKCVIHRTFNLPGLLFSKHFLLPLICFCFGFLWIRTYNSHSLIRISHLHERTPEASSLWPCLDPSHPHPAWLDLLQFETFLPPRSVDPYSLQHAGLSALWRKELCNVHGLQEQSLIYSPLLALGCVAHCNSCDRELNMYPEPTWARLTCHSNSENQGIPLMVSRIIRQSNAKTPGEARGRQTGTAVLQGQETTCPKEPCPSF